MKVLQNIPYFLPFAWLFIIFSTAFEKLVVPSLILILVLVFVACIVIFTSAVKAGHE